MESNNENNKRQKRELSAERQQTQQTRQNEYEKNNKPLPILKTVKSEQIQFRSCHEKILLNSLNFRNRKFKENYTSPNEYKHMTEVGGRYNWYYINEEPIKCWKDLNDKLVIQDGHRRFIEGLIQGYEYFLVEITGPLPEYFKSSNELPFGLPDNISFEFKNDYLDINKSKVIIKHKM